MIYGPKIKYNFILLWINNIVFFTKIVHQRDNIQKECTITKRNFIKYIVPLDKKDRIQNRILFRIIW